MFFTKKKIIFIFFILFILFLTTNTIYTNKNNYFRISISPLSEDSESRYSLINYLSLKVGNGPNFVNRMILFRTFLSKKNEVHIILNNNGAENIKENTNLRFEPYYYILDIKTKKSYSFTNNLIQKKINEISEIEKNEYIKKLFNLQNVFGASESKKKSELNTLKELLTIYEKNYFIAKQKNISSDLDTPRVSDVENLFYQGYDILSIKIDLTKKKIKELEKKVSEKPKPVKEKFYDPQFNIAIKASPLNDENFELIKFELIDIKKDMIYNNTMKSFFFFLLLTFVIFILPKNISKKLNDLKKTLLNF